MFGTLQIDKRIVPTLLLCKINKKITILILKTFVYARKQQEIIKLSINDSHSIEKPVTSPLMTTLK